MIERFLGPENLRRLVDAIRTQQIVQGDETAASTLAGVVELQELNTGDVLISQGHADNDLYLIISGRVEVLINRRKIAERPFGCHVGELALIDPRMNRSASVVALEQSVVGKVSEPAFTRVAEQHPSLWRALARQIGERLRERSRFIKPPNDQPVVFIGSSSEALSVATAIRDRVQSPDVTIRIWSKGVFGASSFPMEDLERQLLDADFAVLVASPDDVTVSRGVEATSPRDNVIFEAGLFMGALSRQRTFLVVPHGIDVKIPTDLLGLTTLRYQVGPPPNIEDACASILEVITKLGPR